jgi:hypothetical protein
MLSVPLHGTPERGRQGGISQYFVAQFRGQPSPDRHARTALDPTFTLIEVERIGGETPMNHMRAPWMKIQPLVTYLTEPPNSLAFMPSNST